MEDKNIIYPDDMLEELSLEAEIFSEVDENVGVALFSEEDGDTINLRIYQLLFDDVDSPKEVYYPIQELAAFNFASKEQMTEFIKNLPKLSGLDMLMLLNPLENLISEVNKGMEH